MIHIPFVTFTGPSLVKAQFEELLSKYVEVEEFTEPLMAQMQNDIARLAARFHPHIAIDVDVDPEDDTKLIIVAHKNFDGTRMIDGVLIE